MKSLVGLHPPPIRHNCFGINLIIFIKPHFTLWVFRLHGNRVFGGLHLIEEPSLILTIQSGGSHSRSCTMMLPGKISNSALSCQTSKHPSLCHGGTSLIPSQLGAPSGWGPTSFLIYSLQPGPDDTDQLPLTEKNENWDKVWWVGHDTHFQPGSSLPKPWMSSCYPRANLLWTSQARGPTCAKALPSSGRWRSPLPQRGKGSKAPSELKVLVPCALFLGFIASSKWKTWLYLHHSSPQEWDNPPQKGCTVSKHGAGMQIHANVSHIIVKDPRQAQQERLTHLPYFCCDSQGGLYLITAFSLKSESPLRGSVSRVCFQKFNLCVKYELAFTSCSS